MVCVNEDKKTKILILCSLKDKLHWMEYAKSQEMTLSSLIRRLLKVEAGCVVKERKAKPPPKKERLNYHKDKRFVAFLESYPRQEAKLPAYRAWLKLTEREKDQALEMLKLHKLKWLEKGTEKQFIPLPATWLNSKRFEDAIEEEKPKEIKNLDYFVKREKYK